MSRKLLQEIFQRKLTRNDTYHKDISTPIDFDDAILEARDHGITIKAFADTGDKMVFHPGHLGYNFNYYWGNGTWSSRSCWGPTDDKIIRKANNELFEIAKRLEQDYRISFVQISGTDRGYISVQLHDISNYNNFHKLIKDTHRNGLDDYVIFVYGINKSIINNYN